MTDMFFEEKQAGSRIGNSKKVKAFGCTHPDLMTYDNVFTLREK